MDRADLPPYSVRRSARARSARLTYHPRHGLVVVVPTRYDDRRIPGLVAANLAWVDRVRARLGDTRIQDPVVDGPRPTLLLLRAFDEQWTVRYSAGSGRPAVRRAGSSALVVASPAGAEADALGGWLARRSRRALAPILLAYAERLGVAGRLERLSIRNQKSRWGSCSLSGTICLSRNLAFLPPELARLVVAHEACHLRELNHSPSFWQLVGTLEPRVPALRRELRAAWRYVPTWADPTAYAAGDAPS